MAALHPQAPRVPRSGALPRGEGCDERGRHTGERPRAPAARRCQAFPRVGRGAPGTAALAGDEGSA